MKKIILPLILAIGLSSCSTKPVRKEITSSSAPETKQNSTKHEKISVDPESFGPPAPPPATIVAGVAALATGFVLLYTKVGWFHDAVDAVWGFIKRFWPYLLGPLVMPFALAAKFIVSHFSGIKDFLVGVFQWLKNAASNVGSWLSGAVSGVAGWVSNAFANAINWVVDRINTLISAFNDLPGPNLDPLHHVGALGRADRGQGGVFGGTTRGPHGSGGAGGGGGSFAAGGFLPAGASGTVGEVGMERLDVTPLGARITPLYPVRGRVSPRPPTPATQPVDWGESGALVKSLRVPVYIDRKRVAEAVAGEAEFRAARQ